MGVGIGEAHWSYSGFNDMRRRIARVVGFDLNGMIGYSREGNESWMEYDGPLREFFMMADAGGWITPESCVSMANELREVLENPMSEVHLASFDTANINLLIEALEESALNNKTLVYS